MENPTDVTFKQIVDLVFKEDNKNLEEATATLKVIDEQYLQVVNKSSILHHYLTEEKSKPALVKDAELEQLQPYADDICFHALYDNGCACVLTSHIRSIAKELFFSQKEKPIRNSSEEVLGILVDKLFPADERPSEVYSVGDLHLKYTAMTSPRSINNWVNQWGVSKYYFTNVYDLRRKYIMERFDLQHNSDAKKIFMAMAEQLADWYVLIGRNGIKRPTWNSKFYAAVTILNTFEAVRAILCKNLNEDLTNYVKIIEILK